MPTEAITTHDIKLGDIIWMSGLRLRVATEPRQTNHPINEYSPTLAADAIIENWEDVKSYVGNLATVGEDGLRHWTVQGNGLAQWAREVPAL
jgi:hypothetical protein